MKNIIRRSGGLFFDYVGKWVAHLPVSIQVKLLDEMCRVHKLQIISPYEDHLSIVPPNDGVLRYLLTTSGYHEHAEISRICRMLDKNAIILDIGANVGFWTLPLAEVVQDGKGLIHSFEPTESTFRQLEINIALNELEQVMLNKYGISDVEDVLELSIFEKDGASSGWNTFGTPQNSGRMRASRRQQTRVRPLDDWWMEAGQPNCNFVKIDIEGFEVRALRGGSRFFSHHKSREAFFVFAELNSDALEAAGSSAVEFFDLFAASGYEIFQLDHKLDLMPLNRPKLLDKLSVNVIAAPLGNGFSSRWTQQG